MSLDKLKTDPNHKEQFIQDYLAASEYVDAAIAAEASEAKKKPLLGIKDNLVALFVNSGTADCESLQNIYGPKVEANTAAAAYAFSAFFTLSVSNPMASSKNLTAPSMSPFLNAW